MSYLFSPETSFQAIDGQAVGFSAIRHPLSPHFPTMDRLAALTKHDFWISFKPDEAHNIGRKQSCSNDGHPIVIGKRTGPRTEGVLMYSTLSLVIS